MIWINGKTRILVVYRLKRLRLIPTRGGCWDFVERFSADTRAGLAALALRLSFSRDGCSWNWELNLSYGPTRDWLSAWVFTGLLVNGLLVAAQLACAAAVAAPNDELTTLNAKAVELYNARKYIEATPLAERALAIREKSLGPNHHSRPILNNLAGLYEAQGRYADAEPKYKREIAIYEKTFGTDHPNVARALNGLAILYTHQARYGDAERLYIRVLAIREKALGPNHPDARDVAEQSGSSITIRVATRCGATLEAVAGNREKSLGPNIPMSRNR